MRVLSGLGDIRDPAVPPMWLSQKGPRAGFFPCCVVTRNDATHWGPQSLTVAHTTQPIWAVLWAKDGHLWQSHFPQNVVALLNFPFGFGWIAPESASQAVFCLVNIRPLIGSKGYRAVMGCRTAGWTSGDRRAKI